MKTPTDGFFLKLKRALFGRLHIKETLNEKINALELLSRSIEDRTVTLESLIHIADERSRTSEQLIRAIEERSVTLEVLLNTADERSRMVEHLVRITEQRSNTLEFVERQALYATTHQIDQLQKMYVEIAPVLLDLKQRDCFNASRFIALETDFPIAVDSNDHIEPDSTAEGVSRPTFFVQECMRILGPNIKALDLGTGAAGLVFEWAMNGVTAIGVDGSDFCRTNKIGYWPLLPNNLFTCDITKPYRFISLESKRNFAFDVITAWEVLEHIPETDVGQVLQNVHSHLQEHGYFVGSISLVEYLGKDGIPYHVTLQPKAWWRNKFLECGLTMLVEHPFNEHVFCRGNGPAFQDFHNYFSNPQDGFHFVAQIASKHRYSEV